MNNFDTSTKGVNIELTINYDCDLSRHYFEENFKLIDHSDTFLFIDHGNFNDEFDPLDLDNYTYTKADLKSTLEHEFFNDELKDLAQYHHSKPLSKLSKDDLQYLVEYEVNDLSDHFKHLTSKFELINITGYCQGDHAQIIFRDEDIAQYNFEDKEQFLNNMRDYFSNLFYDAPIYFHLELDGEHQEIYASDLLANDYIYDKNEVLLSLDKLIKHDKKAVIMEYLKANMPENLEYI